MPLIRFNFILAFSYSNISSPSIFSCLQAIYGKGIELGVG